MPAIRAKVIGVPRGKIKCSTCGFDLTCQRHVLAFGSAWGDDPPFSIRLCLDCASMDKNDKVLLSAVRKANGLPIQEDIP